MNQVAWAATAVADLEAIRTYLEQFGDDVAQGEIDRPVLATDWLLDWPEAGPAVPESDWRKWKPRGASHLLIYRPTEEGIEIARLRHEREDWTRLP